MLMGSNNVMFLQVSKFSIKDALVCDIMVPNIMTEVK